MKALVLTLMLSMCAASCSGGDQGSAAKCAPLNEACVDASECCPGSICATKVGNPLDGLCVQTCERAVDCASGCCHGIDGTSDKVCDIAAACDLGTGGTAGTGGSGGSSAVGLAGEPAAGDGGTPGALPACEDADVPASFPSGALELDATTDCNNTPLTHAGELLSSGDSDWFSYGVADEALCAVQGSAKVTGGEVQLCAFGDLMNCKITCTTGTAASHEGYDGCCVVGADPSLKFGVGCGIGESAAGTMLLQVTSTSDLCLPYELSYGF